MIDLFDFKEEAPTKDWYYEVITIENRISEVSPYGKTINGGMMKSKIEP